MHRRCAIAGVLFTFFLVGPVWGGGKKDPAEEVIVKMIGHLEKMADTLSSIKDEETVTAAKETLKKQVLEFIELRGVARKLPPPSREVRDRLAKEYKKKMTEVQEKVMLEVVRVRTSVPMGRAAVAEVAALLRGEKLKTPKKDSPKEPREADKK